MLSVVGCVFPLAAGSYIVLRHSSELELRDESTRAEHIGWDL